MKQPTPNAPDTEFSPALDYSSVESFANAKASVAFFTSSKHVFREQDDMAPLVCGPHKYMPWGADNRMPYEILELIEKDETLSTCQIFNSEVCYGAGLHYLPTTADKTHQEAVADFFDASDIPAYFLGVCQDFNHYGFAVSVIVLNKARTRILRVERKEAMYCRFAPQSERGRIPYIIYANFRNNTSPADFEKIPLLNPVAPLADLRRRIDNGEKSYVYAVVSRVPTADSTYYPIPHYAALFRGKWYDIKQLIGIAKEANLKNSAPIKYHIGISVKFWENIFRAEGITDPKKQQARVAKEKARIIDFLTGAENSGKTWFSAYYTDPSGKEQHDVKIERIENAKEGGNYITDIQEAINMFCFTMRVHSNLVGSVPGSAQSNNSGSDKRELYVIAQALKTPYRDILFNVHRLIIAFNGWKGYRPVCPFIQPTTLDTHRDADTVTT